MGTAEKAKTRQRIMQSVLCGVLVVCLALAGWVSGRRRSLLVVVLDSPKNFSEIGVNLRVPRGWTDRAADGSIVIERPAQGVEPERRLVVRRLRSRSLLSALEALQRCGMLQGKWWALPEVSSQTSPVVIAGWPGVMVTLTGHSHGVDEARVVRVAAAVLPSRDIIALRLETFGTTEPFDADVIAGVGESISIDRLLPPAPVVGDVELGGGVHVNLPDHFLTLPRDDDWRTGLALHSDAASPCVGIELVPSVFLETEDADSFATILSCRDPHRVIGPIEKLNGHTWVCRTISASEKTIVADYLVSQRDGQALLAEFHADASNAKYLDGLWSGMAASVRFPAQSDIAARLEKGAEAVAHLHAVPPVILASSDDRFLYWDKRAGNNRLPVDFWLHPGDGAILGQFRMDAATLGGNVTETKSSWWLANDLSSYEYEMVEKAQTGEVGSQKTVLADGKIKTAAGGHGSAPVAEPPQFVPGSILPHMLARLRGEKLMLRTESCVIAGNAAARGLMTLLIDPCADHPHLVTTPDEQPTKMAAVRLSINGTGEISRWYFDLDGNLHLIELSEDVQLQREDGSSEVVK